VNNIKIALGKEKFNKYKLFILANLIIFILEFFSLLSIPIFVSAIINPEYLNEKIILFSNFINLQLEYQSSDLIKFSAILVCASFYIKNIFLSLTIFFENRFYRNFKKETKKSFFDYYVDMPYLDHTKTNPSELIRNTLFDVDSSASHLEQLNIIMRDILALLVVFAIMIMISDLNAVFTFLVFLSLFVFYLVKMRGKIRNWGQKNQKISKTLIKLFYEAFGSIKDVKVLSKEDEIKKRFDDEILVFEKNSYFFNLTRNFPKVILEVLAITILILISLIYLAITNNTNSLFTFLSIYAVLIVRFIPAFNSITSAYGYLKMSSPRIENVAKQVEFITREKNKPKNISYDKFSNLYKNDYLKVDNLSYTYPTGKFKSLRNISLSIDKGSIIGIAGPTGSGKTTLFHSMLGLIFPQDGNVYFNGKSIYENNKMWRHETGLISQNIFLLDNTIKKNISFNLTNDVEDEKRLEKVIEIAQLKEKLNKLPMGLETKVGVDGLQLSGGERQRIAIARILYREPNIIFMDESTSALDEKTEENIITNLINIYKGKTIIIITHRPKTLNFCDKKFLLNNGKLEK
tara:strand:+ start:1087 stop:2811 length:1725 start_codon:yes stop_codon:yes gene_type:complete